MPLSERFNLSDPIGYPRRADRRAHNGSKHKVQRMTTSRSTSRLPRALALILLLGLAASLTGCAQAYYSAMEQIGHDKRDILRSRIEGGRNDQEKAQEQFKTTYERLKETAAYDGGDLEAKYNELNSDYERSVSRSKSVTSRINSIENVARDLWTEWQAEIDLIGSQSLRGQSRKILNDTKSRYQRVIGAMKRAESKMPPVLDAFRDQVLFMKHNLNARAIAALEGSVGEIENDVESLIREIDASIREAESFLAELDPA